ncbi:MAG: CDP-alcohol phosphatidyltransferase family protein [Microbacteriaceae bacterium]
MHGFRARYRALAAAQKPSRGLGTPAYTRWINRSLGRVIAALTPPYISATALTLIGAVLSYGATASLWLYPVNPGLGWIIPGLLLVIGYAFDSADGQISRLRGSASPFGEWLDHTLDAGRVAFIHFAAGVLCVLVLGSMSAAFPAAAFLVSSILILFGKQLELNLLPPGVTAHTGVSRFRGWIILPVDFGVLCLSFLLLPWPLLFVSVYMVLAGLNVLYAGLALPRWGLRLRAAEHSSSGRP